MSHMRPRRFGRFDETRLSQQAIGVRLRLLYDHVVREPVPPEWLELLRQADERQAAEVQP